MEFKGIFLDWCYPKQNKGSTEVGNFIFPSQTAVPTLIRATYKAAFETWMNV